MYTEQYAQRTVCTVKCAVQDLDMIMLDGAARPRLGKMYHVHLILGQQYCSTAVERRGGEGAQWVGKIYS